MVGLRKFGAVLVFALACLAYDGVSAQPGEQTLTLPEAIALHLQGVDSGLIVNAATRRVAGLEAFYAARGDRPVWVADGKPTDAAKRLRSVLAGAARDGLDPDAYDAGEFSPRDVYSTARYDVAQSAAALRYVNDLHNGRATPSESDPRLFVAPRTLDAATVLAALTTSNDIVRTLADYAPPHVQYKRLRAALAAYRARAAAGPQITIPATASLRHGDRGPAVATLRARLRQDGIDPSAAAGDDIFDDALNDAVIAYQKRRGLAVDGIVGPATRAALNVPVAKRIQQIELNMERWRWLPDDLGNRHIIVNIAGFALDASVGGIVRQHMKVVVGRTYRRTPVFSHPMTYLEINPYWHVPPSIAVKDELPKIRKSLDFLAEQGIRVFDGWGADAREIDPHTIDWASLGPKNFPYKLRQDPGPKNALGRIKFMLPNGFNVYLHDTPARQLFDRTVRVFSSGCIRVERPRDLALFVLDGQPDWDPAALDAAFASKQTRKIVLRNPVPVHITYQTAWVDDDGTLEFRNDIYKRDATLARVLFAPQRRSFAAR